MKVYEQTLKKQLRLLLFGILIIIAGALSYALGWTAPAKVVRAERCIQCGAGRIYTETSFSIFGLNGFKQRSQRNEKAALTGLWEEYLGGCNHNWTFHYINTWRGFERSFGCGFPYFRFPAATSDNKSLASAISTLPNTNARIAALKAIGNGSNWLRFVAADALESLYYAESSNSYAEWWTMHSNCFEVITNPATARTRLQDLQKLEDLTHALERGDDLLNRYEEENR